MSAASRRARTGATPGRGTRRVRCACARGLRRPATHEPSSSGRRTTAAIRAAARRAQAQSRSNIYSADARRRPQPGRTRRPGAGLRSRQRRRRRRRDQPATFRVDAGVHDRRAAAARRAVLGPQDAVRRQRPRQQPDADQPADRAARKADPGRGSVQPVLHARRPVRDRRRRAPATTRLPRPAHDAARPFPVRAEVPWRRPHGLLRRRALRLSPAANSPRRWSRSTCARSG